MDTVANVFRVLIVVSRSVHTRLPFTTFGREPTRLCLEVILGHITDQYLGSWPDLVLVAKSIFTLKMNPFKMKRSIVFDFATSTKSGQEADKVCIYTIYQVRPASKYR